jgi:hypothetical protein
LPGANDGGGNDEELFRAVVFVTEVVPKGRLGPLRNTPRLLVMLGREYATLTFAAVHAKVCELCVDIGRGWWPSRGAPTDASGCSSRTAPAATQTAPMREPIRYPNRGGCCAVSEVGSVLVELLFRSR